MVARYPTGLLLVNICYFDFFLQYISAGLKLIDPFLYPTFAVLINGIVFKQKIYRTSGLVLVLTYLNWHWLFW